MPSNSERKCGSFRALREKHLSMFEEKLHRHDRGWPHPLRLAEEGDSTARPAWRIHGILHFRDDGGENG
jgi:hypothetical protein